MLGRIDHPLRSLAEVTIRHQEQAHVAAVLATGGFEADDGRTRCRRVVVEVAPLPVRFRLHYAGGVLEARPGDRFQQPDGSLVAVEALRPRVHTLPGLGRLVALEHVGGAS